MLKGLITGAALTALIASSVAFAQEPRVTQYQDWVGVCADVEGREVCEMQQILTMENETGNVPLFRASVHNADNGLMMQLLFPLGLDLRAGMVLQIDEGDEYTSGFLTCVQEGCLAAFPLDSELLAALRAGNSAKVGFRPFNTDQTLVLELSLSGFTAASQTLK